MSDALYVVKVSGQFAGAVVARVIENVGDVATVPAALRRGPYEDASQPYMVECIVDAGGGSRRRWVDWVQVTPKPGLTSVNVTWGRNTSISSIGCVVEVVCFAGNEIVDVMPVGSPVAEVTARTQRMIKLA